MKKLIITVIIPIFLLIGSTAPCGMVDPKLSTEEIEVLAEEAYKFGLQQVMFYETRYKFTQLESSSSYVGTNRLLWFKSPIAGKTQGLVTPNDIGLYGWGFLDLSMEPVVLEIPAIKDRYYSFEVIDQYGEYYFLVGSPFTGVEYQKYILIGLGWQGTVPAEFSGTQIIVAPSNTAFMAVRMALASFAAEDEVRIINTFQEKVTTTPLDEWLANGKKGVPYDDRGKVRGNYASFPRMAELTQNLIEQQTAMDYFRLLSLVLNDSTMSKRTDSLEEVEVLKRLAKIGLQEGVVFDPAKLSDTQKAALEKGFAGGKQKVKPPAL